MHLNSALQQLQGYSGIFFGGGLLGTEGITQERRKISPHHLLWDQASKQNLRMFSRPHNQEDAHFWLWMGLRHLCLTLSTLGKGWEGTAAKLLHLDNVLGKKHRLLQEAAERIHKGKSCSGFVIWPWKAERETVLHNQESWKIPEPTPLSSPPRWVSWTVSNGQAGQRQADSEISVLLQELCKQPPKGPGSLSQTWNTRAIQFLGKLGAVVQLDLISYT